MVKAYPVRKITTAQKRRKPRAQRRVYVDFSEFGYGVFTAVPLRHHDVAFFISGTIVSTEENNELPEDGSYSIQVGLKSYLDPVSPSRFINHSCLPNVGIRDDYTIVALREIAAGEELRFDYSTSMLERSWSLECGCGEATCRGTITDFDFLPLELQDRYLSENVVQQFIVDYLNQSAEKAA